MDAVQRASGFFRENGRDIDRARFAHHFEGAPLDGLLATLARYQNQDGGFGNALEPDIQAPESNPFAMALALQMCAQARVPQDHELLRRAEAHLEASQDPDGGWRFAPSVYEHGLAPWYAAWEWPSINPACQLAGGLRRLGLGSEGLHSRVEGLFRRLARVEDLSGDAYYGVLPYAHYLLPEWEHPERELYLSGVLWWLIRWHAEGKVQDGAHFFEYVPGPDTYTGRLLPERIREERLNALEAEQAPDGGWPTEYDEHWRGHTTVQNLLTLRAFGRV
jgi:hypothetical protein